MQVNASNKNYYKRNDTNFDKNNYYMKYLKQWFIAGASINMLII